MAAQQGAMPRPGEVACPDPAAHGSRAQRSSGGRDPFGSDGKLSAASSFSFTYIYTSLALIDPSSRRRSCYQIREAA